MISYNSFYFRKKTGARPLFFLYPYVVMLLTPRLLRPLFFLSDG